MKQLSPMVQALPSSHETTLEPYSQLPLATLHVPVGLKTVRVSGPAQVGAGGAFALAAFASTALVAQGAGSGAKAPDITGLWDGYRAGFAVVTSQEVDSGIVKLSQYKAVLPTNGVDAN